MTERLRLIDSLRRKCQETLGSVLGHQRRLALLDFPNYANVGDSAIWLGDLACLESLGIRRPRYTCDLQTYDRKQLARRLGGGTILLRGGGNLGDLYMPIQRFRERVIEDFPRNPIVQLPQSIFFASRDALARARRIFNRHPNLTLLVRDRRSLEIARNEFRASSLLCPDSAFCLGPLNRPAPASQRVFWLARSDKESAAPAPENFTGSRGDWLGEPETPLRRINAWFIGRLGRRPKVRRAARKLLSWTYAPLARQRLARGCRVLSMGRTVVTDRLHGHILCLLLGIPHVLLENSYGKNGDFYTTWTSDCDLASWGASAEEAVALVGAEIGSGA